MARTRKDWKLGDCTCVTTKEEKVEISKPKPASTTVTVIDAVTDADALLAHINSVEQKNYTVGDILADYVNQNILTNARIQLRQTADPDAVVSKAIEKLHKQFANLPEEQLAAMAQMIKESMAA